MTLRVKFRESAWQDFDEIYDWIAARVDPGTAHSYLSRIEEFCSSLGDFPRRGTPRNDLAPGVRTTVFEGKAVIAYIIDGREVQIVRVLHHGRDVGRAFKP